MPPIAAKPLRTLGLHSRVPPVRVSDEGQCRCSADGDGDGATGRAGSDRRPRNVSVRLDDVGAAHRPVVMDERGDPSSRTVMARHGRARGAANEADAGRRVLGATDSLRR